MTHGFGNRPYNWQGSVGIAHQLLSGVGVEIAYFRTSYGNFVVTDNTLVTPADFDSYSITAPSDERLPGGGGQTVSGLYDLKQAKFGLVQNVVKNAKEFGKQSERYNGVEANLRGRLPHGGLLLGGVSVGRTSTNNCEVAAQPSRIEHQRDDGHTAAELRQHTAMVRGNTVPALGGSSRCPAMFESAEPIRTSPESPRRRATWPAMRRSGRLGRNLSGGGNATRTIDLIRPNSFYPEGRGNQIDFRVSRRFQLNQCAWNPSSTSTT